jgi:hypothetical protein
LKPAGYRKANFDGRTIDRGQPMSLTNDPVFAVVIFAAPGMISEVLFPPFKRVNPDAN